MSRQKWGEVKISFEYLNIALGYGAMVVMAVSLAFWSKSPNLKIASLVVLTDWLLSTYLNSKYGNASVNYIAPMNVLFFGLVYTLFNLKHFRGGSYYGPLLFLYFCYLVIGVWYLGAKQFFPDTLSATEYYFLEASNVVFVCIILMISTFSILKGIGNRAEGGLMVVFDDWSSRISNFSREYKEMTRDDDHEESDVFGPIAFCFKKHILKKEDVQDSDEASASQETSDKVE